MRANTHKVGRPHQPRHQAKTAAARIKARRAKVAELLLQSKTYREIARTVGVRSTQTIFEDVKAIIAEWQKTQQHHVNEWIAIELEKVGHVEAQAWEAWERSQEDAEIQTVETGSKEGRKSRHTIKGQVGDAHFLDVVLKCVQRRCELLGLDAPKELNVPGLMNPEEIEARRKARWEKVLPALQGALTNING